MKKTSIFSLILAALIISSCGTKGPQGELIGIGHSTDWYEPDPYGMVFIPQGSFNMGMNDQDITSSHNAITKTVSIAPFWMDETEITNSEYKQFVYWVRDSIARRLLAINGDVTYLAELTQEEQTKRQALNSNWVYQDPQVGQLNWDKEVDWKGEDPNTFIALKPMYYEEKDRISNEFHIDTRKIMYKYSWVDLAQAAKYENRYNFDTQKYDSDGKVGKVVDSKGVVVPIDGRKSFIMEGEINVYPDTLVWMRDWTYSYNEPMTRMYFWHTSFNDYPVVGVNWSQANAFTIWRTQLMKNYQLSIGLPPFQDYRLPTEAEWEYAARGGLANSMYPWGGYYTRNVYGCFIANFKPLRGNYVDDGGIVTLGVKRFAPNEYGLYDMAGNVSEWTSNAYDESAYSITHDLNPNYVYRAKKDDDPALKRKVIRGGSWKDIAFFMQVGVRSFEFQDTAKAYIGFRCVRSFMGKDQDWNSKNFGKPITGKPISGN